LSRLTVHLLAASCGAGGIVAQPLLWDVVANAGGSAPIEE
jgi:hypothetical protein